MPDDPLLIEYTPRALKDSIDIKGYILKYFTEREVNAYYALLQSFEKVVTSFPELYAASNKNKKVRRAVLSKQLSVFYTIGPTRIVIIAIMDNRMDDAMWP